MKIFRISFICMALFLESPAFPASAQSKKAPMPELIRDTDVAEGKDASEEPKPKEQDPKLAKLSISIGNFYLKQKNYDAAIERYLEAIEYQPSSIRAYEALAQVYEKKGEIAKAIGAYKTFLEKNPNSPGAAEFGIRIARLEKKAQ
jgi:tetratricopeptide (TPR) repeat protein